jgi:Protein of unknown function (DUF2992).
MDDFTTTTIYFDGQFWSALVVKQEDGCTRTGRYVFGAEPANPQLLYWMIHEYADIPLFPSEPVSVPVKKMSTERSRGALGRSLGTYRAAQQAYLSERKQERRECVRADRREEWRLKLEKRKQKRRH